MNFERGSFCSSCAPRFGTVNCAIFPAPAINTIRGRSDMMHGAIRINISGAKAALQQQRKYQRACNSRRVAAANKYFFQLAAITGARGINNYPSTGNR